ncbi:hypothetical protein Cabys_418 [Caldithrix abyssi DSM 13497]|uniref:Uncharacterized protein n=1 Tax=Caldithrix abyssi DSM 13497 TaxID=880073 RepID=A0A1J1C4G3_CALAY|nr:hypothetical protein Cabys_418 [Caldithrix abyssi DSM 13497]
MFTAEPCSAFFAFNCLQEKLNIAQRLNAERLFIKGGKEYVRPIQDI